MTPRLATLFLTLSLLWLVNGNLEPEGVASYSYHLKFDAEAKSSRTLGTLHEGFSEGICASGKSQSPITIPNPTETAPIDATLRLKKDYWKTHKIRVTNSYGHTLQGDITGDPDLTISGSLLNDEEYIFDSFHFHWGSESHGAEHLINGTFMAASEMHLIHFKAKYENKKKALASNDPAALAVIGIMFEISDDDNPNLKCIISGARNVKEPGTIVVKKGLNLSALIFESENNATFARYNGSLTTPGCNEVVLWNVKVTPTHISKRQLTAFRNLNDDEGNLLVNNYRPLQDINDRTVEFLRVTASPPEVKNEESSDNPEKKSNDEEEQNEKSSDEKTVHTI